MDADGVDVQATFCTENRGSGAVNGVIDVVSPDQVKRRRRRRTGVSLNVENGGMKRKRKRKFPSSLAGGMYDLSGLLDTKSGLGSSHGVERVAVVPKSESGLVECCGDLVTEDDLGDGTVTVDVYEEKRSDRRRASSNGKRIAEVAANPVSPSLALLHENNDEVKENGSGPSGRDNIEPSNKGADDAPVKPKRKRNRKPKVSLVETEILTEIEAPVRENVDCNINGTDGTSVKPKRKRNRKPKVSAVENEIRMESEAPSGRDNIDPSIKAVNDASVKPKRKRNRKPKVSNTENEALSGRGSSELGVKGANGTSVKPSRKRNRKPQVSEVETQIHKENEDEENGNSSEYFLEEDEDNLEENAAMMLSSRFNPRCTGLPAKGMPSSLSVNEASSRYSNKTSRTAGLDLSPVHALRPRKDNGRGFARKRRHFYEVRYNDMDPFWVVKQRIRIFWPLDKAWYFGLVKEYDPNTGLHHVKYDDRDQEWVDLKDERFKLLLFPSEVKSNSEISRSMRKRNGGGSMRMMDDNCRGTVKESETIKRTPRLVPNKVFSTSPEKIIEGQLTRSSTMEKEVRSDSGKLSMVYSRKRPNRRDGVINMFEGDAPCASSTGPITLLASIADRELALEEWYFDFTSTEPKQILWKLSLPCLDIHQNTFGAERYLLYSTFLLHHGKLMHLWPEVYMELVFVDNGRGLRWLSFKGCLRRAVYLVCLIMSTFYKNRQHNMSEIQAPYTSIGVELSGLHDRRGHFIFTLCSFSELSSKRWRYLSNKLKQSCMIIDELPIGECIHFDKDAISSRSSSRVVCPSLFDSPELSTKGPSLDITKQLVKKSAPSTVDPGIRNFNEDCSMLHRSIVSFAAAPLFSLEAHIKFLMENNGAAFGFQEPDSVKLQDCQENFKKSSGEGCLPVVHTSDQVSEISNKNPRQSSDTSGWSSIRNLRIVTGILSVRNAGDSFSFNLLNDEINISGNPLGSSDVGKNKSEETSVGFQRFLCPTNSQGAKESCSPFHNDSGPPDKSGSGHNSSELGIHVEESCREQNSAPCEPDLLSELNQYSVRSPKITAPRTVSRRGRHCSLQASFGPRLKVWPEDSVRNGFDKGSKKPRTQVSYSSHGGEFGSKTRCKKERIYKKAKTESTRRVLGIPESPEENVESLTCSANVLVTGADRGWREYGAHVVLESDDQKDWRLLVTFHGTTRYGYKAQQVLQPGVTNRYNCAMMWKGGKDWTLEFIDRSQWSLFKMMHQECLNRNIKAASVKNIPIPGVHLIDYDDDDIVEVPFIWSSSKYYRQVGTEIDMALDPCHVMYDMDSSDEEWISNFKNSLEYQGSEVDDVTDAMFERAVDMFEKVAYSKQCDSFTSGEIEDFMAGFGPLDVVKAIYEFWQHKRLKKGLPLVRQFQPPLWEHYQRQLRNWELSLSKLHRRSGGYQEKARSLDRPPMFAFCLKPRRLEVRNKASLQRSHKKFMYLGQRSSSTRLLNGFSAHGRKSNGHLAGEDKGVFGVANHELLHPLRRFQSPSNASPKDAGIHAMEFDDSDASPYQKYCREYTRRNGVTFSPRGYQTSPFSNNERSKRPIYSGTDNRPKRFQPDEYRKHHPDENEFKYRDASSAAQHAQKVAKLKRAKAQMLVHKADLAIHRARAALTTAELIKSSQEESSEHDMYS